MSRGKAIAGAGLCSLVLLGVLAALAQTAEKPPTELYVRTSPPNAQILVDGKDCGRSPGLFEVEPGDHTITVKLEGYGAQTRKVAIREGRIRRVILELQKQPEARDEKLEAIANKTAWGEAVEGVQLRAYAEKPIWIAGETPALRADMRNTGGNRFKKLVLYSDCWELELDGQWYRTTVQPWGIAKVLPFGPGTEQRGLVVPLWEHLGWQSRDGNQPLQFLPGGHTIRVAFCLSGMQESEMSDVHTRRRPELRKERVVSGPIEVVIRPASDDQPSWGKAVEGVQCRLRADKNVWTSGEVPTFKADLRNGGSRTLRVVPEHRRCNLVLDGKTYNWPTWEFVEMQAFPPGMVYRDIPISLVETWAGATPLKQVLAPGRHQVSICFQCQGGSDPFQRQGAGGQGGKVIVNVESNAVEFEIRPAGAAQPDDREKTQPAETEARKVVETFLAAVIAGRTEEAIRMTDPASAVGRQLEDIRKMGGAAAMKVTQVGVKDNTALAVTTQVKDDRDREGVLLIRLIRSGSRWVVQDIDFTSVAEATSKLEATGSTIEVEIVPAEVRPKAPDQEPAWGKQVENLQCRIRAEKAAWTAGTVPKLFGDLRVYDMSFPALATASENWEIEIDGKWHKNQRAKLQGSHGGKVIFLSWPATEHWVQEAVYQLAIDAEQSAARSLRALAPGKHVLRAGYRFDALPPNTAKVMSVVKEVMGPHRFSRSGKAVHVVSNPIEIEILPDKPATASGVSGEPKLSPRKLFSASHGADVGILGVAFSPDGLTVAAVDEQGKVALRDARSGGQRWGRSVLTNEEKKLLLYEERQGQIHTASIAYSPDGYTLAVAADPVVRLYDAQSGRLLRTLEDKQLVEHLKDLKRPPATVSRELELLAAVPHAHGRVYCVAFSPDGTLLATSGSHLLRADGSSVISAEVATPGKLKLWDAKTGQLKRDLGEHFGAVRSVAFSPDGKTLASLGSHPPSWTSSVRLCDPQTGTVKKVLRILPHSMLETAVALSPDGKLVAAGAMITGLREDGPDDGMERLGEGRRCRLLVFNAQTGDLLFSRDTDGLVSSVSFSANGKTLATGVDGRGVTLWDPETLEPKHEIQLSTDRPRDVQVAFSPTGNLLAVGAKDTKQGGFITVWEVGQGEPVASPQPASSPRKLFSASHDAGVGVLGATFSPDGKTVAAVDGAAKVILRDARSGRQITSLDLLTPEEKSVILHLVPDGRIHSGGVAFSPDGTTLAVGGGPIAKLFDAQTHRLRLTLEDKGLKQESEQMNLPDRERWAAIPRAHGSVYCVAFSPDGTLLATSGGHIIAASGATPGQLKLWDAKTGELKQNLGEHFDAVRSVAFSPDGKILASAARHPPRWTSSIRSWDPQTGTVNSVLAIPRGDPWSVAFSPDGKLLAAGGIVAEGADTTSGMLLVWNARAWTPLLHRPLPSLVASIAFSADGKTLAAGEYGKGVTLWDPETGKPKGEIQPQTDLPRDLKGTVCVAFSPTGSLLAIGAENERHGFLSVWDLGQPADRTTTMPAP